MKTLPLSASAQRRDRIRKWWSENEKHAYSLGFSESVVANITSDNEEFKYCWCCGAYGYQEMAHIKASTLGGSDKPENIFLLCNECHAVSPDHSNANHFVSWVNENEGRNRMMLMDAIESALSDFVHACNNDIYLAGIAVSEFKNNLKKQQHLITQHSANTSSSTRRCAITDAMGETINTLACIKSNIDEADSLQLALI